jgi:hypothetical protein
MKQHMTSLAIGAYPNQFFFGPIERSAILFATFFFWAFCASPFLRFAQKVPMPRVTTLKSINGTNKENKENKESFLFRLIFFPSPEMIMRREGHQDQERWEWNRATLARHGTALRPNNGEHE